MLTPIISGGALTDRPFWIVYVLYLLWGWTAYLSCRPFALHFSLNLTYSDPLLSADLQLSIMGSLRVLLIPDHFSISGFYQFQKRFLQDKINK